MKSLPIFVGMTTAALLLTGCGSSSNSTTATEEEHAHSALISQANTTALSVLEEGTAENLEDAAAANGAQLLLAANGEAAAIITAGSVQFVAAHHEEEGASEEEHELPEVSTLSVTGTNIEVANTNGHFSVLVDGATQLVPYESLEEGATPEAEDLGIGSENYPALLLEEGDELVALAFTGGNAVVYEDATPTADTKTCTSVDSAAQNEEFVVVSCAGSSFSVKLEEPATEGAEHTIEIADIANISTAVEWSTRADVFVGLGADDKFYVVEENASEALELEGGAGFAASADMCAWGIDSANADIFALTASALTVYNHEGEVQDTIVLDTTSSCDDLKMATASQAVFVIDNASQTLYEIDKEAVSYHIHGREDVSVNDVASIVSFHEIEEGDHDHSH